MEDTHTPSKPTSIYAGIDSSSLLSLLSEENEEFFIDEDSSTGSASDAEDQTSDSGSDSGSDSDCEIPLKKKKKKRKKRMKQPPKTYLIPKTPTQQSKANAQILFDYIAPHVDKETLQMLLSKMKEFEALMEDEMKTKSKRRKTTEKKIMEYQTLIGQVDAFFAQQQKLKKGRKMKNAGYLVEHPWIKSLIAQFFAGAMEDTDMGTDTDTGEMTSTKENMPAPLSMDLLWRDPTFTPNINRKKRKQTVSTLMHAREMSLESPLLWSFNQRRRNKKSKSKGKNSSDDLEQQERREAHYQKSAGQLREEAEAIASLLSFRLPARSHDDIVGLFRGYASTVAEVMGSADDDSDNENDMLDSDDEDEGSDSDDESASDDDEQSKPHVEIMKMLFPNLKRRADFHVHLIATELAEFFYVDVPERIRNEGSTANPLDDLLIPIGRSDKRINEAWNDWNSMRDELVTTFLSSQRMYCKLHSASKKKEKEGPQESKASEPKEDEVNKVMVQYSNGEHKRAEELIEELNRLRTTADGELVGRSPVEGLGLAGRAPKGANLRFECLMLNDKFGPYCNAETALLADLNDPHLNSLGEISPDIIDHLPVTNRTIFIDNLPIDVTREELEYLYSRCGAIESIEIFNLMPELDPGELTKKSMMAQRKQNRMSGSKGATQAKDVRTPVYGMIKFEDEDGYARASLDMLRIFGMVIRRHAVKTQPARNIHTLYIENIPKGFFAMDLEEKLSKILNPDMYISLELGQHVNAQPKSCEITFPTFEVSHLAYQQLQKVHFGDDKCTIHWMKTPDNATAYWTRHMNPEP